MSKTIWTSAVAACAVCLLGTTASAAVLSINSVTGTWESATGGRHVNAEQDVLSWGSPTRRSSYVFDAGKAELGPHGASETFVLGDFVHDNWPIPIGSGIDSASLKVTFDAVLRSDQLQEMVTLTSIFDFDHWETRNQARACPYSGGDATVLNRDGCADRVTVTSNPSASTMGSIGGQDYRIDISGFEVGGSPVDAFWTTENRSNRAQLLGTFTLSPSAIPGEGGPTYPAPIPLPAAGWLLVAAIGGLGFAARVRRRSELLKNEDSL